MLDALGLVLQFIVDVLIIGIGGERVRKTKWNDPLGLLIIGVLSLVILTMFFILVRRFIH